MNKYDRRHVRNVSRYQKQMEKILDEAVVEAAGLGAVIGQVGEKPFSWSDAPLAKKKMQALSRRMADEMYAQVVGGIGTEWDLSGRKNDALVRSVFSSGASIPDRYFGRNEGARAAFIARRSGGLTLSDRVWKYSEQFSGEIEMGLDIGIRDGLSASEMARSLKQWLQYPDKLFRRVRDEHGVLRLSQAAKAFHPGRGVYRSSYQNARRLAATETNMAYRTADYERWQRLDFVVGMEVRLSNNHNCKGVPAGAFYDICDELKGRYPKDFKFTGWHPLCRCHAVPITKTEEEMAADDERVLAGEEPSEGSVNAVTELPSSFKGWANDNADRIAFARSNGTLPYFIKDNEDKSWFGQFVESRYTDDYLKQMSAQGIHFKDNIADRLKGSPFNRLDIVTLNSEVQGIVAQYGVKDVGCQMKVTSAGDIRLKWYAPKFELIRSFDTDSRGIRSVDHELFTLSEDLQGKGISKRIFRSLYKQYKTVGVQRMEVYANINVGGYTWARYGFCVADRDTAISAIRFGNLTKKQEDRIVAIIDDHFSKSKAPFPMNKIARLPYGKEALLGSDWEGVLDLTDPTQRRVFERYLR